MAESPSSSLPGGLEWLPALGGGRLLRAHAGGGEPPALLLRTEEDGEHRIQARPGARFSPYIEYLVPAGLSWATAWLQWPDGNRAAVPAPNVARAEIIELRPRSADGADEDPPTQPVAARSDAAQADPPAPRVEGAGAEHPWTAPPRVAHSVGTAAEAEWRSRRADLERGLTRVAEAVALAREGERATCDSVLAALAGARADLQAVRAAREADASALATLAGELDAERSAHAVTRGSVGMLAELLTAARAELAAARKEAAGERKSGAAARAELAGARRDVVMARAELESLGAELGVPARAELEAAEGPALLERVAALDRRAAGLPDRVALERRAREHAEAAAVAARPAPEQAGRLLADLDAAAASLRAPAATTDESPPLAAAPPTPPVALVAASEEPRLRRALVALAREDAAAAGELLVSLLSAQGELLDGALSYDLTVRGVGTFAVSVGNDGSARVLRLSRRRSRSEALFHLAGDPLALAELLAGERRRVGRFGRRARVTGRRKRVRELDRLPSARLSLADAVRAGARLEPALVYRALPFAVAPEWTRGHAFTVAQQIVELAPSAWHVTARDGARLSVVERASPAPADATVTMTRAAFDRLLRGEPAAEGERPVVRGDRGAVGALKRWIDLARGG